MGLRIGRSPAKRNIARRHGSIRFMRHLQGLKPVTADGVVFVLHTLPESTVAV
ncbi:hypothetical protein D9X30_5468 [Cupriavidus sp. U2]|nr:hypothetical protein D9X30_5468 [Cupriavidus sp. U2]